MAQMHDVSDPRNADILINVNGELKPRAQAVVSVFDSGFILGDGVWEGLRVRSGHPAFLDMHLDRLFEGARAILLDVGMSREELTAAVYETLRANDMVDGVHVRLMVTRGVKSTPYQDPRVTLGPATVVVVGEVVVGEGVVGRARRRTPSVNRRRGCHPVLRNAFGSTVSGRIVALLRRCRRRRRLGRRAAEARDAAGSRRVSMDQGVDPDRIVPVASE